MRRRGWHTAHALRALTLLGAASLLPSAGCKLDTQGAGAYDIACTTDSQCNDENPCTTDACSARGVCTFTVAPALVPDDGNDCTTDHCEGASARHEPANEGAPCNDGASAGFCKSGECFVACNAENQATACDDQNPCTLDSCDVTSGKCVRVKLDNTPTPGVTQKVGDCKRDVCVQGVAAQVVDDTDLPVDVECWDESCTNGVPSKTPGPLNAPCGWTKELKCDGNGACVGCTDSSQCPKDDCNDGVCDASGVCKLDPKPAGTPLPDGKQTAHDCQLVQCDGSGTAVSVADDNDPPVPDSSECTQDLCVGGVPLHPPEAKNTGCTQNGGKYCDGAGACVECNDATQCLDPGDCSTRACTSNACVITPKPEGQSCGTSGGVCDGAGKCVGCTKATDCPDPGDCQHPLCSSNTCTVAPDPKDQACSSGVCDGAGTCVVCNTAAQCPAGDACNDPKCTSNVCSLAPKPAGTTCPTGVCNASGVCVQCIAASGCTDPGECKSAVCNNGTCGTVNDDKTTSCGTGWYCNGAGTCVECNASSQCLGGTTCLPKVCGTNNTCGDGSPATKGTACGTTPGAQQCDGAGTCKLVNGQACNDGTKCLSGNCVDGVCCDSACGGLCEACSAAGKLQGTDGTCGPIKSGEDPKDECPGSHTCNGDGACN